MVITEMKTKIESTSQELRELDRLMQKFVGRQGDSIFSSWSPSSCMEDALLVLSRLADVTNDLHLECISPESGSPESEWSVATCRTQDGWEGWISHKNLSMAICLAAKKCMENHVV